MGLFRKKKDDGEESKPKSTLKPESEESLTDLAGGAKKPDDTNRYRDPGGQHTPPR